MASGSRVRDQVPWQNSPEDRRRSSETYDDPVYRRNAAITIERAGGRHGRCERCGRKGRRLQVDHIVNVASGVTDHSLANLQAICSGPGSCHARKTAREGNAAKAGGQPPDPLPRPVTTW
jgi:hypothetical protein